MSAPERFCSECGVALDLHYTGDDCEAADKRAWLVEQYPLVGGGTFSGGPMVRESSTGSQK